MSECSDVSLETGECTGYMTYDIASVYNPHFKYSGEKCVSAVVQVYAPVFLGSVILSAFAPLAFDVLVIPSAAPHLRGLASRGSVVAGHALRLLSMVTIAMPVHVGEVHLHQRRERSKMAINAVRLGFGALISVLAVAVTFGIASPLVGVAAGLSALATHLRYQRLVVGLDHPQHDEDIQAFKQQLDDHGGGILQNSLLMTDDDEQQGELEMLGCTVLPRTCSAVVAMGTLCFWILAGVGYLSFDVAGTSAAVSWVVASVAVAGLGLLGLIQQRSSRSS